MHRTTTALEPRWPRVQLPVTEPTERGPRVVYWPGPMPTLFLMIGLPGAGKTTLAKQLERERPALRLTPDEWLARLYDVPVDGAPTERQRASVESLMWDLAARALRLGVDVVLDFGFWSRAERDAFRARARALGARVELRFCDAPREVLIQRLDARNAALPPGAYGVSREELDRFILWFEPPTTE